MGTKTLPAAEWDNKETGKRIKEYLKTAVSEDVYEKWVKHFVFEKTDGKKIIAGYYGTEPLNEFNKKYKKNVWVHICAVTGYVKKFKVYKRKTKNLKFGSAEAKKNITAAKWFLLSLIFTIIALWAAAAGGSYIKNISFKETFYSVSSLKANNSIRIIQISDLHGSVYGKNNAKLAERIEKLKPDLILFTGDCTDASEKSAEGIAGLCERAAQTAPAYYIYGNNEIRNVYGTALTQKALDDMYGFNDDTRNADRLREADDNFEKEIEKTGVRVLKNEFETVTIGETEVDVYGVLTSNPSAFWSYAGSSFDEYIYNNKSNLKITAIHEPLIFETYEPESWGDIMVAGHNHGDMIRIPKIGPMYTHEGGLLPERDGAYVYGRYETAGSPLIVSAGLANGSVLRINNQPELVIIDINRF